MPTIYYPAMISAGVDTMIADITGSSVYFTNQFDTNMTMFVDWTVCTLQTIYQIQQKTSIQLALMTGNEQVWRSVFNSSVPQDWWIHLESEKMICNDTVCTGIIMMYNVTNMSVMCKFVVMPLIMGAPGFQHFWQPEFHGSHVDERNQTHDLSYCDSTLEGTICKLQSAVYEPCLLQNTINVCKWTVLPLNYEMMVEIAPQQICLVTNVSVIPHMVTPFSGCLSNVSSITWHNETFFIAGDRETSVAKCWSPIMPDMPNWDFNLTRLHKLMNASEDVQKHIVLLNKTLAQHILSTTIVADKIVKVGSSIADATSHHWWDIFMGYSSNATSVLNFLIHPVLALCIVMFLIALWNCYVAYRLCRRSKVRFATYGS
ncbi:uncharacterized protein [Hyperolius riggenbachi]|uniref:uncharacterized protein n=1 Tax=Hyperolius riggenbachi TaxID=752182 RepID=UPI0035A3D072